MPIKDLFKKYIKNTGYKDGITLLRTFVCTIRKELQQVIGSRNNKVFISTRSLKHIYDRHIFDKKTPKDFYLIINNVNNIVCNPDRIYLNEETKRGDFIFVKKINNNMYACILEIIDEEKIEIVSIYTTGEKYLDKFILLWS